MNKKKQEFRNAQITLTVPEWTRYNQVMDIAKARVIENTGSEQLFKKSAINRVLFGFEPPSAIVTQDDIDFFYGKKVPMTKVIEDLGSTSSGSIANNKKIA